MNRHGKSKWTTKQCHDIHSVKQSGLANSMQQIRAIDSREKLMGRKRGILGTYSHRVESTYSPNMPYRSHPLYLASTVDRHSMTRSIQEQFPQVLEGVCGVV